ncbi:MAG: sigma-54-dependent Fis family transcriptional regulator [Deltaproteobacteria bacterium]|nr:sigma-54-dependent Fis family transcriptional regulator [Deltaproteobacteria bacterium]
MARLLIIDDDVKICMVLSRLIESMGNQAYASHTLEEGLNRASSDQYDVILLDLEFPEGNGLQILPDLLKAPSLPEVIIITGTGDTRGAELAFKYGVWDFIQKPFTLDEASLHITRALQYRSEKGATKRPVLLDRTDIIGKSDAIRICLGEIARTSITDSSVLITGETGTGKELFAKAIHQNSTRSKGPFITVDCGALPETLAESTLFGHEKGAFTGADKRQDGLILQAGGGTLFLDEIGDLPLNIQASLLRTLQEHRIRPLGSKQELPVDFRLVSATNRDLDKMVKEKNFRADLLFRIRAIGISLPPLRDRKLDLQEIAVHKIHEMGQRYGLGLKGVSSDFLMHLNAHHWPGNVRELINVLEYALAAAGQDPTLVPKHLPPAYRITRLDFDSGHTKSITERKTETQDENTVFPSWSEFRQQSEENYLRMLLAKAGDSREKACNLSGISQSRLYDLLKKHHLPGFRSS